jgi:hypothetical protein
LVQIINGSLKKVPLGFAELRKRLSFESRMPTYTRGLQGGRQDLFEQPEIMSFSAVKCLSQSQRKIKDSVPIFRVDGKIGEVY